MIIEMMKKALLRGPSLLIFIGLAVGLITLVSCIGPLFGPPIGPETRIPPPKPRPQINIPDLEKQIHALINQERRRHGLASLEWDGHLAAIARKHSRDMVERKYFAHVSPEGHDFAHRYKQAGYACASPKGKVRYTGGENILQTDLYDSTTTVNGRTYYNWNSPEKIAETTVEIWMKSPAHRENILAPFYRRDGLGVVVAADGKVTITQNFC